MQNVNLDSKEGKGIFKSFEVLVIRCYLSRDLFSPLMLVVSQYSNPYLQIPIQCLQFSSNSFSGAAKSIVILSI